MSVLSCLSDMAPALIEAIPCGKGRQARPFSRSRCRCDNPYKRFPTTHLLRGQHIIVEDMARIHKKQAGQNILEALR